MIYWDELEDLWELISEDPNFDHLRIGKNPLVSGEGDNPKAFIIGEAPGAQEVMQRRPFVDPAGMVLRQLMASAELYTKRGMGPWWTAHPEIKPNCWLTNVLKYKPPRNRTPTLKEITDSRILIRREWALVGRPRLIIPVGAAALHLITGKQLSILDNAGKLTVHIGRDGKEITVWPMIHPSYGLRNEEVRPLMEKHWLTLGAWLDERGNV